MGEQGVLAFAALQCQLRLPQQCVVSYRGVSGCLLQQGIHPDTQHTRTTGQRAAIVHASLLYGLGSLRQGSGVTAPPYWGLIQGLHLMVCS